MLTNARRAAAFWLLVAAMLAVAGFLYIADDAEAGTGDSFNLNCAYTRSLNDDPIVYPGQQGASHLHDFFGNRTANYASTTESLVAAPTSSSGTSCQNVKDKAAYWAPAAYVNGVRVLPKNIKAYYVHQITGTIEPFPTGLRMIAGNASATGPMPTSVVYFGCGSGTGISKKNYPPNCSGTSGNLQIHVLFPDCGLPGMLDSEDHKSHMAYSVSRTCPSAYTEHYPQLQMRLNYDIKDARTLTFACLVPSSVCSSDGTKAPYYSIHSDFWNAWVPEELQRLINTI
jgi:hypothetical protein